MRDLRKVFKGYSEILHLFERTDAIYGTDFQEDASVITTILTSSSWTLTVISPTSPHNMQPLYSLKSPFSNPLP